MKTTAKKKIGGRIATVKHEIGMLQLSIQNESGVHTHVRNGERFRGKQQDCPLCKNGSEFERRLSEIGL